MPFADGAEGGPNFESLVLALPMVIVGVILFLQKTAKPIVSVVLVLGGIAIGGAGLTVLARDGHEAEPSASGSDNSYVSMFTGLCEARRLAPRDPGEATLIYQDKLHVAVHDLAAKVQARDRGAAAALLEAKQAVETDIDADEVDGDALEQHLDELLEATVTGLRTIDLEAPTC